MTGLSKDAERQIMTAIEKTAELVNAGRSPNDAIIKAAEDSSLQPGHIHLLVHAYNTGRTTRQRELGETPLEKAADFPLADAATILEALYPTTVKTAAQVAHESAVSVEYAIPPRGMIERRERQLKLASIAGIDRRMVEKPPDPYPRDPLGIAQKRLWDKQAAHRHAEEVRRQAAAAHDTAFAKYAALATYFRTPGCLTIKDATMYTDLLYGDAGNTVLRRLIEIDPKLEKLGTTELAQTAKSLPYQMIGELLDLLDDYQVKRAEHQRVDAEQQRAKEALLRPFVQPPSQSVLESSTDEKSAGFGEFAAGGIAKDVLGNAAKTMSPPDTDGLFQQNLNSLTDPHHEAALRNIRTQAMLQDVMTNDPVISGHDPEDVLSAFNEIGAAAPRAVDQPTVMTAMLRKRLQQGVLDPFETDQLLGMENKIKDQRVQSHAHHAGSVL